MPHARPALVLALVAALASTPALAGDTTAGAITIADPWVRATPPGAQVAAGYATITNHGSSSDRLTGGSFAGSMGFEVHSMTMEGGVMRMRPTGPLDIPAGGTVTLDPTGRHIMLTGLKAALKKGQAIDGTFVFEHAGPVAVRFTVEGIGAKNHGPSPAGHTMAPMPGMTMD